MALDYFAGFPLSETQFVQVLKIEPKFGAGAKEMGKTQSGVTGNGALPVQNLRNSVRGHIEFARKLRGAHAERMKLFR